MVRLSEVYPLLSSTISDQSTAAINLKLELSIWEALEIIERENLTEISLTDEHSAKKNHYSCDTDCGILSIQERNVSLRQPENLIKRKWIRNPHFTFITRSITDDHSDP